MAVPPSQLEDVHIYGYLRTQGVVYQLEDLETSIGRGEECSLQLDGKGISRLHARLTFHGRRPQLLDLGSSNGTFVNGLRLRPNIPYDLKHGDVVRFAQARCTYSFELSPEVPEAKSPKTPKPPKQAAEPVETPPRSAMKSKEAGEAGEGKEKPSHPSEQAAQPNAASVPCVNFLPVPFPFMQPGPVQPMQPMQMYASQFPPQPPTPYPQPPQPQPQPEPLEPAERPGYSHFAPESEMLQKQDLLLQRLWKLEESISRLADVCQRASHPEDVRDDKRDKHENFLSEHQEQTEEAHQVAAALAAATERLNGTAGTASVAEFRNMEGSASPTSQVALESKARPVESLEKQALDEDPHQLERRNELIAEMQRMLALYEMVMGAGMADTLQTGKATPDSSSSSSASEKAPRRPLFEGAVGETSVVLTAIMSSLEELAGMGYANPSVGGHRRWSALANERERLAKEEAIEAERLRELEEEEARVRQSTETELSELSRLLECEDSAGDQTDHPMFQDIQTTITAPEAFEHLQAELARVQQDRARLEAESTAVTGQLLDAQQSYREAKAKADTASKFFASAEEMADELQEWRYSGRTERMAALERMMSLAQAQVSERRSQQKKKTESIL